MAKKDKAARRKARKQHHAVPPTPTNARNRLPISPAADAPQDLSAKFRGIAQGLFAEHGMTSADIIDSMRASKKVSKSVQTLVVRGDVPLSAADVPLAWDAWKIISDGKATAFGMVNGRNRARSEHEQARALEYHNAVDSDIPLKSAMERLEVSNSLLQYLHGNAPELFYSEADSVFDYPSSMEISNSTMTFTAQGALKSPLDRNGLIVISREEAEDQHVLFWKLLSTPASFSDSNALSLCVSAASTTAFIDIADRSVSGLLAPIWKLWNTPVNNDAKMDYTASTSSVVAVVSGDGKTWTSAGGVLYGDQQDKLPMSIAVQMVLDTLYTDQETLRVIHENVPGQSPSGSRISPSPPTTHKATKPAVRIINLTPLETPRNQRAGEHSRTEPDHRWMTSGYWRNQPCGPNRSDRRRVFISPHINGPKGKPVQEKIPVVKKVALDRPPEAPL